MSAATISIGFPDADRQAIVGLLRDYEASLGISLCFQGFEAELQRLPGDYAPPTGAFIVARLNNKPVGMVALRLLDAPSAIAELKRLYVAPAARGISLGRRLAEAALAEARRLGYRAIRLDTLPTMTEAVDLYTKLGFIHTLAYTNNPVEGARFLEKSLT